MTTNMELEANDGHKLAAYRADPQESAKGCVLVIQEIFGVNAHIRSVCDGYAAAGYRALAPAIFDRTERGVELDYEGDGMKRGIEIAFGLKPAQTLLDLQAGIDALADSGKVGVVGYCFGGTYAWIAAGKLERVACASGYYGGQIGSQLELFPRCPTILHFGEQDTHIPMTVVDAVREKHPSVPVHVYPAGHGFNCDARESHHRQSANLALERTLALFAEHLA